MTVRDVIIQNELPADWHSYRLGDLAVYWNGRAFKPEEWQKEGRPIIRIENLNSLNAPFNYFQGEIRPENEVDDGDLLVSWSASLDAYMWDRGPAVLNQHIFKVEENRNVIRRRFFYYLLRHTMSTIRTRVHGGTMQHITKPKFERIEVLVPLLQEQDKITRILDNQIEAIKKARAAAEARLEAAKALPSSYVRSIFENPEAQRWPKKRLIEICETKGQYGTSAKSNSDEAGLPILGMSHIYEGRIRWENVAHVELSSDECEKYRLKIGDLLFNRTNSAELVGKTAVYNLDHQAIFASYLIRFRIKKNISDPRFVSTYINSNLGREFIERKMARAIGQVNISASTMHEMPVPTPDLSVQQRLSDMLDEKIKAVDAVRNTLRDELETINFLPASLLRRAFNGEL